MAEASLPIISKARLPRDLPVTSFGSWDDVQAVRSALVALDQGQFNQAALLLDTMLGDSHVAAKLSDRLEGLFGSAFAMRPPPGLDEDNAALELAELAQDLWIDLSGDAAERAVVRDGLMLGAGLAELVGFGLEGEPLVLKHWHMRHVHWRWDTRTYWVSTSRGTEELQRDPDHRGAFLSTWKDESGAQQVSRWWLYTPYGYQRGWPNGRIKAIAIPWLLRMWAFRDWGRHSETLGIPPKVVGVPAEWNDDEKRRALTEIASLASEGVLLAPKKQDGTGFTVELLELKGPNAHDTFDGLIERAEAAITVALVGQTLTTQSSANGGNRALGEVHERVEGKLRRGDAGAVSRSIRACILRPWAAWTVGDENRAPIPTWEVDPPQDLKTRGDGLVALGAGIKALQDLGVPIDRARIVAEAAVPLEEDLEDDDDLEEPVAGGDPATPGALPGSVVQDTALNGAQVQALQAIIQAVADGELPASTGKAVVKASFPAVTDEDREAMFAGLEDFEPTKPEPAPGAPPPPGAAVPPVEDEQLSRAEELSRRTKAAVQGQVYADALADHGVEHAARILAGDVRALRRIVDELKPTPEGGIDIHALRAKLLEAYRDMNPDRLASLVEKCVLLASLSGRYAVQKEL